MGEIELEFDGEIQWLGNLKEIMWGKSMFLTLETMFLLKIERGTFP